jgi:ACT domain-containing protein
MMEECKLTIKLEDRPGELSKVLDIVAKNKGNLISISHLREKEKDGVVPVIVKFEATKADFESLVSALDEKEIEITDKVFGAMEHHDLVQDFLVIGHVIDTDIKDTIYGIFDKDANVRRVDIGIKGLKEPSSAFFEVSAKTSEVMEKAIEKLRATAKEKKLTLVEQIT